MAISDVVQSGLFEGDSDDQQLIRIPIRADENVGTKRRRSRRMDPPSKRCRMLWTTAEHDRFLEALELYPSGPWKVIADHVGTRTTRQTMTHAQKYREKIERRKQKKRKGSVVRLKTAPESSSSPAGALLDDAKERAVLMEFVKNFQPSEIDIVNQPQHPYTQGSFFLLNVCV
ncbi:myb domain-contaning protein [Phytophthora sojae]|uniref:Myb domain-contaning protein n=1 Tax=Phytophthora sojae (strain P6497) TaxID=1094619 RepID=G4Z534_PHYSP|nr:myb domain-contaning protein [Phytophthora sojae]EGZ19480.1 myb domain-contaning protein [Phytophthora sojae]|eukprot:XP_009522197.1 myb domain-contaning protein [Phytophthora sojae]